ncbi:TetR/AcrR family transcriptional regulator [Streptomyces sp. NBC_01166]|uniref:TetR/AcrR family transcriptional regulator n=1 Tax=Streptomyces sp. NBC_01166 TaxID=2903755 RepID=UPI00386BD978|nr:TetR/AcrR family transcriptional regulator [Streptomyces sp. NBC_01166]
MARRVRSEERKKQLVKAAEECIAELGLSALTIREIASRAGMSPGSVLYHYPETDDLVYDVHRALVNRYVDHRMQAMSRVVDPSRRLVRAFESGLPSGPEDQICGMLYELHGLATRSKQHAALMTSLWDREIMLYESIIDSGLAAKQFRAEMSARALAEALLAMEDGLGLHIVSDNASVSVNDALNMLVTTASVWLKADLSKHL